MGQKVNPIGLRLSLNKGWLSKWYAKKGYAKLLHEDLKIRAFIKNKLYHAGISKIEIERQPDKIRIYIYTARPGIIIGRKGQDVENMKKEIEKMTGKAVYIKIKEVKYAEVDAQLVAENIALQLERRVSFRRAMKKAVSSALRYKAKGIRIRVGGRLGGAEMARVEQYLEGRVPLHTLRAEIDYGIAEAMTTYGVIGVKCWIYKGDMKMPSLETTQITETPLATKYEEEKVKEETLEKEEEPIKKTRRYSIKPNKIEEE